MPDLGGKRRWAPRREPPSGWPRAGRKIGSVSRGTRVPREFTQFRTHISRNWRNNCQRQAFASPTSEASNLGASLEIGSDHTKSSSFWRVKRYVLDSGRRSSRACRRSSGHPGKLSSLALWLAWTAPTQTGTVGASRRPPGREWRRRSRSVSRRGCFVDDHSRIKKAPPQCTAGPGFSQMRCRS
jgi:hypothetical protein